MSKQPPDPMSATLSHIEISELQIKQHSLNAVQETCSVSWGVYWCNGYRLAQVASAAPHQMMHLTIPLTTAGLLSAAPIAGSQWEWGFRRCHNATQDAMEQHWAAETAQRAQQCAQEPQCDQTVLESLVRKPPTKLDRQKRLFLALVTRKLGSGHVPAMATQLLGCGLVPALATRKVGRGYVPPLVTRKLGHGYVPPLVTRKQGCGYAPPLVIRKLGCG